VGNRSLGRSSRHRPGREGAAVAVGTIVAVGSGVREGAAVAVRRMRRDSRRRRFYCRCRWWCSRHRPVGEGAEVEVIVFVGPRVAVGNGVRVGATVAVGICEGKAVADGILEACAGYNQRGLTARVEVKVGNRCFCRRYKTE